MIRIHSGRLKGQTIKRPGIVTTKETASMVREAVFNSLYSLNGYVLDLFAGSGSYGFTAYSLGADYVHFIEHNNVAFDNLRKNVEKLKVNDNVKLYKTDYKLYLKTCKQVYDYIFLDPPFNFSNYEELLIDVSKHTNKSSVIILEMDKRSEVIESFNDFIIDKNKVYGSKRIVIYVNK